MKEKQCIRKSAGEAGGMDMPSMKHQLWKSVEKFRFVDGCFIKCHIIKFEIVQNSDGYMSARM